MKIILFLSFTLLTILFDQPYVAQVSVNTAVNQFVQDPVNKNAMASGEVLTSQLTNMLVSTARDI